MVIELNDQRYGSKREAVRQAPISGVVRVWYNYDQDFYNQASYSSLTELTFLLDELLDKALIQAFA